MRIEKIESTNKLDEKTLDSLRMKYYSRLFEECYTANEKRHSLKKSRALQKKKKAHQGKNNNNN